MCEAIYRTKNSESLFELHIFLKEDMSLLDLSPERAEFIGLGETEAHAFTQLARAIAVIAENIGYSYDNTLYLNHRDWPDVMAKAQAALRIALQPR